MGLGRDDAEVYLDDAEVYLDVALDREEAPLMIVGLDVFRVVLVLSLITDGREVVDLE